MINRSPQVQLEMPPDDPDGVMKVRTLIPAYANAPEREILELIKRSPIVEGYVVIPRGASR